MEKAKSKEVGVLNKFSLGLTAMASKGDKDGGLTSLRVRGEHTEITNGHYAVRIGNVKIDPGDYPMGTSGETICEDDIDINMPLGVAESLRKNLPAYPRLPVLQCAVPMEKKIDGRASFVTYDLETWSPIVFNPVDGGRYSRADLDAATPKGDPVLTIGINPEYLMKICKLFKSNGLKGVKFEFYGDGKAIKITGRNPETGQDILTLLMPMVL